MASLLTNASAQAALSTLRNVAGDLQETQDRISTGLRVRTASDSPAFFLVSQQVNGDLTVFRGLRDNLNISINIARTASNGVSNINSRLNELQETLIAADNGTALNELQFAIQNTVDEISGILESTSFNGVNLLTGTATSTVTTAITRDGGTYNIQTFTLQSQDLDNVNPAVGGRLAAAYAAFAPEVLSLLDGANTVDGLGANGSLDFTAGGDDDANTATAGFQINQLAFDRLTEVAARINASTDNAVTVQEVFGITASVTVGGETFYTLDNAAAIEPDFLDPDGTPGTTNFTTGAGNDISANNVGTFLNEVVLGDGLLRQVAAEGGFTAALRQLEVAGVEGNVAAGLALTDALLNRVNVNASTLGTFERTLENRQDFTNTLISSLEQGIAGLIEANLDEESTRLQAFQVQEQLAIQSLTIANQRPQNLLALFR